MYLDYKLDESYTPNKIAIRAGNSVADLKVHNLVIADRIALADLQESETSPGEGGVCRTLSFGYWFCEIFCVV